MVIFKPGKYTYKKWKQKIFEEQGYYCQKCFSPNEIQIHHILKKSKYPALKYDTENGFVLCHKCHVEEHKYEKN